MKKNIRFVGLDVHADTISVAVAEADGSERSLGRIPNRIESIRKLIKKLGDRKKLKVCYEAGPTGYVLYWQLEQMGVTCEVVAPTLIPTKPGDRVKTDRRDALKLARCYRAGDLTAVWVPSHTHEALRDLVRARTAAKADERRARQRLQKLLLRHGVRRPDKVNAWTIKHREWLKQLTFDEVPLAATFVDYLHEIDHQGERIKRLETAIDETIETAPEEIKAVVEGLQALRGVAKTTAVGVVAEIGKFSRFEHPRLLMGYSGSVPGEHSTGGPGKHRRGRITKSGNTHLRRMVTESAWSYRHKPSLYPALRKRQQGVSDEIREISWNAQVRLSGKYRRLLGRGKEKQKAITAVSRELLGFIWAIAVEVESKTQMQAKAA